MEVPREAVHDWLASQRSQHPITAIPTRPASTQASQRIYPKATVAVDKASLTN